MMPDTVNSFGRGTLQVCRRPSGVLIVAISCPKVRNAFNDDVYLDLIAILRQSAQDEDVTALVLTGMGSFFSSGADLSEKSSLHAVTPDKPREMAHLPAGRFMVALIDFPKVICAAVNGPAVGIAATLLLHCDLVFCSTTASFWAPFARLALCPELASSISLCHVMGMAKANEILLLSRKLDAETMVNWNIASRVVSETNVGGPVYKDDPFASNSLASFMAQQLEQQLLSLPLGKQTASYFAQIIKEPRRQILHQAIRKEFAVLDERFNTGQVAQAFRSLKFGKKAATKGQSNKKTLQSKL
jgi:peroxisomal 3,2-trans-enoyl-CoA isomerase